jgi:hypothetical protein
VTKLVSRTELTVNQAQGIKTVPLGFGATPSRNSWGRIWQDNPTARSGVARGELTKDELVRQLDLLDGAAAAKPIFWTKKKQKCR